MLTWLWNKIPQEWKLSVALKKVSYGVGKAAVAILTWGKIKIFIGDHLTPDQMLMIQNAAAAVAAAALEALHDWARVKWPDKKWL